MKYNFDEVIDRTGTAAVKIDGMNEVWGRTGWTWICSAVLSKGFVS